MPEVLIALGSNLGDRVSHLCAALEELKSWLVLESVSSVYETAPMYVADQPAFYNAAVRVSTGMAPMAVLGLLKATEAKVGRLTGPRYGPREIDLDLVGYGCLAYRFTDSCGTRLQIPHPRTPERRFVLQPLSDVAPEFELPGLGRVKDLLRQTERQADSVRRIEDALFPI